MESEINILDDSDFYLKSINDNDIDDNEEDNEILISILSGMNFTPPYEEYIIKAIHRIINKNIKVDTIIFDNKILKNEDIFNEFKQKLCKYNNTNKSQEIKKSNILNNDCNNNRNSKNLNNNIEVNNNIHLNNNISSEAINDIVNNKMSIKETTENNVNNNDINNKNNKTFDKGKIKNYFENNNSSLSNVLISNSSVNSSTNKSTTQKKLNASKNLVELNNIEDSFNINGDMFEVFVQSMIFLTLKCFEEDENNKFSFIFNLKKNMNKISNIHDIELDFLINNLDVIIFKSFLNYFKDNIIFFKYNGKSYQINKKENSLEDLISNIEETRKLDIIGEIGQSAWKDKNKVEQFKKYCELIKPLDNDSLKKKEIIKSLNEELGFQEENQKLIIFVTDSPFEYIFKFLNKSDLLIEMNKEDKQKNVNSLLLFMSLGLEERAKLTNYVIKKQNNINANILKNIKRSNNKILNSILFKKLCYKFDDFLNNAKEVNLNNLIRLKTQLDNNCKIFVDIYIENYINFEIKNIHKFKDIHKINKKKKGPVYNILYFTNENNNNTFKEELKNNIKIKEYSYFEFIDNDKDILDKKCNEILELENNNKLNIIQFLIFDNIQTISFQDILRLININNYDQFFFTESCLIPSKLLSKNTHYIKQYTEFFTFINEKKKVFEEAFILINESKFLYNKLINTYLHFYDKSLIYLKKNNIECLYQKINENVYFMLNLKLLEIKKEKQNQYANILLSKIDLNIELNDLIKTNNQRISSFIDTLKETYNNKNMNLSKLENIMKERSHNLLSQKLIEKIIDYLKNSIYPFIRWKILEFLLNVEIQNRIKSKS